MLRTTFASASVPLPPQGDQRSPTCTLRCFSTPRRSRVQEYRLSRAWFHKTDRNVSPMECRRQNQVQTSSSAQWPCFLPYKTDDSTIEVWQSTCKNTLLRHRQTIEEKQPVQQWLANDYDLFKDGQKLERRW